MNTVNIKKTGFSIPDIINGAALLKAAVSREEFAAVSEMWQNARENTESEDAMGQFGEELFFLLLDKATDPKVGAALEKFICGLFSIPPEVYAVFDVLEMWERLKSYADRERWAAFFGSVKGMTRLKSVTSVSVGMASSLSNMV